jgi:3-hydroxyacyl-[acyl-carrier-protein] dehydratase
MPPQLLFEISDIDLSQTLYDQQAIRLANPQRDDMEMLNGIVYADAVKGEILGFKDVRADEFWVGGHIPGRPLLPGVLMIESAAQLSSFYARTFLGWTGFIGFGSVEECKFRAQVSPGSRMYILARKIWERHRRIHCRVQGLVDGNLAFEAAITGVQL